MGYYKPTNARERKEVAIHYLRIHNMHHHKTIERMGFIYHSYKSDVWWFEMIELLRKMVMNGLISIILPDSPTQIIITLLAGLMLSKKIPFLGNLDYKHQM